MNNNYSEQLIKLLEETRPELVSQHRLEFKSVFGAVGCHYDGTIFASCGKFGFAVRLPSAILDDLFAKQGATHLKYFPKGHVKKEYAVLPKKILENKHQLGKLIDESLKYVGSL
jgi:TfoX/Sxy family transcriptional regulator of competence genes